MPAPEFSRKVAATLVAAEQRRREKLVATPAECVALAERCGIDAVVSLRAEVSLRRVRGGLIRVDGKLCAEVVQRCVVTLEPVTNTVEEPVSAMFGPEPPEGRPGADRAAESLSLDDDEIEPFTANGMIDIGEVVTQHLILGLDPFPRRADASFDDVIAESDRTDIDDVLDVGVVPAGAASVSAGGEEEAESEENEAAGTGGVRRGSPFAALSRLRSRARP